MNAVEQFETYRPLLFSIAYRMLGSVMEAEDMVQETFLRYRGTPGESIRSPKAFLSTVITRLCLNQLDTARVKREAYIGPWLPEPLVEPMGTQPLEMAESLSLAFLRLLESLSPSERVAFLLRDYDWEVEELTRSIIFDNTQTIEGLRKEVEHARAARKEFARIHRRG